MNSLEILKNLTKEKEAITKKINGDDRSKNTVIKMKS